MAQRGKFAPLEIVTIDGAVVLSIKCTIKALDTSRSNVYRLIAAKELEVVRCDGRPKITARSILKRLGLADKAI